MQRGTCFINYEDFRECFGTYKSETKSSYCIHSSVSVQYHNKKNGTNIREDIIFTQVKFCCCKIQGHNGKRKNQENICPAFFFLQYDMEIDRLVLKDECSTHIHSEDARPPAPSLIYPIVQPEPVEFDVPAKKVCEERLSVSPNDDDNRDDPDFFLPEAPCKSETDTPLNDEDVAKGQSDDPPSDNANPVVESISQVSVSQLQSLMQSFQARDIGSRSALSIDCQDQLIQICFQTSKMNSFFVKFPESLLIHKVATKHGFILYTFLVENKERMGKVVHFSFVKEDEVKLVSRMLRMFKDFNADWTKVKVLYVDVSFKHKDLLKEAFPSAQILLSVYHTVCLIQKKMKGSKFKNWIRKCIDEAIYQTTPEKLNNLAEKLQHKLDKELYDKLCTDWFSCELLWYMHVKKGLHACSLYMDSLGLLMDTISSLLAKQTSMELTIQQFVESADCFNSKGLENQRDGTLGFSKRAPKVTRKRNKRVPRPLLPSPSSPTSSHPPLRVRSPKNPSLSLDRLMNYHGVDLPARAASLSGALAPNPKAAGRPQKTADVMLLSLREHCNDLGFQLCSKEWEAIQKSTHLINVQTNFISVQILEESHEVSFSGSYCSCYFQNLFKLPCRHILSMLCAHKKLITEEMVCLSWQQRYIKPISDAKVCDTVLYYSKSAEEAKERVSKIQSLAKELSNLLLQCDGSEIQVRISTLQMVMDMWRNQVSTNKECLAPKQTNQLPYQWVKKEPQEGEENTGCYELERLDHFPAMN